MRAEDELGPEWQGEGPITQFLGEKMEAELVQKAEKAVLNQHFSQMIDHKLKWKSIRDADPCGACGWTAPKGF